MIKFRLLTLAILMLVFLSLVEAQDPPCGNGVIGSGLCTDASLCCSEWGWCDNTEDHCNANTCHSGPNCNRRGAFCGNGVIGTGLCQDSTNCCSEWGWCDNTPDHCDVTSCWSGPNCPRQGLYCGNGIVGTGLCEDASLCCSQYGYCGTSTEYCNPETCYSNLDNSCTRPAAVNITQESPTTPPSMSPTTPPFVLSPTPGPTNTGPTSSFTFPPTTSPSSTMHPSTTPGPSTNTSEPTDFVVDDESLKTDAVLLVTIEPQTSTLLDAINEDPTNATLHDELRDLSIRTWSSTNGLDLATTLDASADDNPTYLELRGRAQSVLPFLCNQLTTLDTQFSPELIDCACGMTQPAVYCVALADRELLDLFTNHEERRRRRRTLDDEERKLQASCEMELPFSPGATPVQDIVNVFKAFEQVTEGKEICFGAKCNIPFPPPVSFIALEISGGGCLPGIDLQTLTICEEGTCRSLEDQINETAETNMVNEMTDPRVFVKAGVCLNTGIVPEGPTRDALNDVKSFLEFVGISLCVANAELSFHPLMGYLGFDGDVKLGQDWLASAKLGVKIEWQFYDEVKEASGVCTLLEGDECEDQSDSDRGQNSCSLCAGQNRGKVYAELRGFVWFKKDFDVVKFGEDSSDCKSCNIVKKLPCVGEEYFDKLTAELSDEFNSNIFLSQPPDPSAPPVPSTVYKFQDFMTALKNLDEAGENFAFWYGDDCSLESQKAALVNMAAFLGQAMRETIIYDACDENNWDKWRADIFKEPTSPPENLSYLYPMSSGCGQLGQKYAEYRCDDECPQDLSMEITATTNAAWIGAPPPLVCGPKSKYDGLGYWNPQKLCQSPDNSCVDQPFYYEGQTAGVHVPVSEDDRFPAFFYTNPLPDATGAVPNPRDPGSFPSTNVEGCCWWGRGVIQTTGRCNFGKLNKFLGAGAGSGALYPEIDFCRNPQSVCSGPSDLKWVAGIFFWVSDPQQYDKDGFNYQDGVKKFVAMGCADNPDLDGCDFLFEYASGIVNRGCHDPGESGCPGCVPGATCDPAHNIPERVQSSKIALRALMKSLGGTTGGQPEQPPSAGTCGGGSVGNGQCATAGECCSSFGWCGTTPDHCGNTSALAGTCGGGSVGDGQCTTAGECCSSFGWCGTTPEHCSTRRNLRSTPLFSSMISTTG